MKRKRLGFILCVGSICVILWFLFDCISTNDGARNDLILTKAKDTGLSYYNKLPVISLGATTRSAHIRSNWQRNNSRSLELLTVEDVPNVQIAEADCAALFEGSRLELWKAAQIQKEELKSLTFMEDSVIHDCKSFIKQRQYAMKPVSREEYHFPIAFSILVYKDIDQFERLLRAIYRPQNFYCVHIEKKSPKSFKDGVKAIASCFNNVFIAPVSISVEWGEFSVLEPELVCMKALWKRSKKWKYFINLTGQEFPLKTIGDIVKILKVYNGANNMEGTVLRQSQQLKDYLNNPPFGMTITKGSVHITASRAFVDYVLHNSTALKFVDWIRHIPVPDELFFSSLNHNPQLNVPGAYKGIPETDTRKNLFITRFKNWGTWPFVWLCNGMWVRQICIFGVGDLPLLSSRPELFANKFYKDYQPLALACMEERHYNMTRDEILGKRSLGLDFYKDLDFVKNHV